MKMLSLILTLVAMVLRAGAVDLDEMRVLYIGEAGTLREKEVSGFLRKNVGEVKAVSRAGFAPADAADFDVVVLDWPQSESARLDRGIKSPLGDRREWEKPTVLLGSAGLNLAVAWRIRGGSGCTCLYPFAYGLREHEIFEKPFPLDRSLIEERPTPSGFSAHIHSPTTPLLPLVRDASRSWKAGWCTYNDGFDANPDIEVYCGGENDKTPTTAAAVWRQGNLLHFGFEQSPAEMNESGQRLLLNPIAYISRFAEDRPIAVTPSVFAGPVALPRTYLDRRLRNNGNRNETSWMVTPELFREIAEMDASKLESWYETVRPYLHPGGGPDPKLEIDAEARALSAPIDQPLFFERCLAVLDSPDASKARSLLARYAPSGTEKHASPSEWESWFAENRDYLFFSDQGDYRWYIDPLAKKRGIPSASLRGPARASAPRLSRARSAGF